MLSVVYCLLFVVCWLLVVDRCLFCCGLCVLFRCRCSVFVVCCLLCVVFFVCWLLAVDCWLAFDVRSLRFVVWCLLFHVCCLRIVGRCLLLAACWLLFVIVTCSSVVVDC